MNEEYTPDEEQIWVAYEEWSAGLGGADRTELTRFLDGVREDVLRDAIEDIDAAGLDAYAANAVVNWLAARADRIKFGGRR